METVSVVIRTYTEERWDYFVEAVTSVQQQNNPPEEIVLVVDHNPELLEKVRTHFPDAVVVESKSRGSSGAWNSGIEAASMDVVAFIDDDAVAAPDWLEKLLQHYVDPHVLGVGGSIIPNWLGGEPRWFPSEFTWVVGCTYRGMPETVAPIRNLIGCNMSFRRTPMLAIGGFKEVKGLGHMGKVPVGCDETEMSIRLRQRNPTGTLLHEPESKVLHKVPAQRARWGYFRKRCYLEGQSKAVVSELVGTGDGLASEMSYTLKTLPQGVLKGIIDTFKGDIHGIRRSFAIILGLGITSLSYLQRRLSNIITNRQTQSASTSSETAS